VSRSTRAPRAPKRPAYTAPRMTKTKRDEEALRKLRVTIGRRLDDLRRDRKLEAKGLYGEMHWHKSEYSRKHRGQTPLDDEEIVMLRRILNAPTGWPHVSVEEGLLVEALGERAAEVLKNLPDILRLLDDRRGGKR
jgi:hypothetical protein